MVTEKQALRMGNIGSGSVHKEWCCDLSAFVVEALALFTGHEGVMAFLWAQPTAWHQRLKCCRNLACSGQATKYQTAAKKSIPEEPKVLLQPWSQVLLDLYACCS